MGTLVANTSVNFSQVVTRCGECLCMDFNLSEGIRGNIFTSLIKPLHTICHSIL